MVSSAAAENMSEIIRRHQMSSFSDDVIPHLEAEVKGKVSDNILCGRPQREDTRRGATLFSNIIYLAAGIAFSRVIETEKRRLLFC
jgi:hypothetical protein